MSFSPTTSVYLPIPPHSEPAQAIAVDVCYDGEAATDRLSVNRYDVAVLDRDMPKATGDSICRWLVGATLDTRILIVTAAVASATGWTGWGWRVDYYQ